MHIFCEVIAQALMLDIQQTASSTEVFLFLNPFSLVSSSASSKPDLYFYSYNPSTYYVKLLCPNCSEIHVSDSERRVLEKMGNT